ncbi:MAG: bifunctional alpha/beta hydrolase/OsmC family protein [Hyphomicrobiales bacterium]
MTGAPQRIDFRGSHGARLSGRMDLPAGRVRAYALFAHCFTCSKDVLAARRIALELARRGIAVLRFDFTGLGSSDGEFSSTDFSSNVGDLLAAVDYMREHFEAPRILVGHSLGGAAALLAAASVPEVAAVATIGAPADALHVIENFRAYVDTIEEAGEAEVELAGRRFTIRRELLDDLAGHDLESRIAGLGKAIMVMHSPADEIVGIDNATRIFRAARHPKSFVSLDNADHLLTRPEDSAYVADVIAAWASRYVAAADAEAIGDIEGAIVAETGEGKFQNVARVGRHRLFADEPERAGGLDSGPSPYDYLSVALAACTSMTLRMYADFKKLPLGRISVEVVHGKVHAEHCEDCGEAATRASGKIDRFERRISIAGEVPDELRDKIVEIANKCPVHRTLEHITESAVVTRLIEPRSDEPS